MFKNKSIKNFKIELLLLIFAIIYGIRMFMIRPWYDELYTYYSFISRGPVYAGIHWPLPNNHIGYSVLSACLNFIGSPTIALRGVSYIASVANVYLVYALAKKIFKNFDKDRLEAYGIMSAIAYATVNIVHTISVQGRGYSLSTTCFLLATIVLLNICEHKYIKKYNYLVYTLSLFLGIYLVPSSTFWVIPLCIVGGLYLLLNGKVKIMWKLVTASLVAAVMDLCMYGIIWLAIGSNILSKTADSVYYGIYQLTIIKMSPMDAMKAGIDYMMASPYIQSIPRKDVITGLFNYLEALFTQFYPRMGIVLIIFLTLVSVLCLIRFIVDRSRFLELFLCIQIIMLPVMMIIQSKAPYLRVYTFFGVVVAFSIVYVFSLFKLGSMITYLLAVLMMILLFTGSYNCSLGDREDEIVQALMVMEDNGYSPKNIDSIFYVDDYQKYILKFYYDIEPNEVPLAEAHYVMLTDEEMNGVWPLFYSEGEVDREYVQKNYNILGKFGRYTIYNR